MNRPIIPVSIGELVDKLTILQIKSEKISDPSKLNNVRNELAGLTEVWANCAVNTTDVKNMVLDLKTVNEKLWKIEDDIRAREKSNIFDDRFIELARSVYQQNDKRARIKRQINEATGSDLVEEKEYCDYVPDGSD